MNTPNSHRPGIETQEEPCPRDECNADHCRTVGSNRIPASAGERRRYREPDTPTPGFTPRWNIIALIALLGDPSTSVHLAPALELSSVPPVRRRRPGARPFRARLRNCSRRCWPIPTSPKARWQSADWRWQPATGMPQARPLRKPLFSTPAGARMAGPTPNRSRLGQCFQRRRDPRRRLCPQSGKRGHCSSACTASRTAGKA